MHRDIRENLAVNLDLGLVQAIDQAAVGQTVQAGRRVDTRDPELPELPLALAPIAIRVLAGLDNRLLGRLVKFAARAVIALRLGEDLLVTRLCGHTAFYSCHVSISS